MNFREIHSPDIILVECASNSSSNTNEILSENAVIFALVKNMPIFNKVSKQEILEHAKFIYVAPVRSSHNYAIIVTKDEEIYTIGSYKAGCFDIRDSIKVNGLTHLKELCNIGLVDFKSSNQYTIARTSHGRLYCWGRNYNIEVNRMDRSFGVLIEDKPIINEYLKDRVIIEMSCGGNHSLFLTSEGEVYESDYINFGQTVDREYYRRYQESDTPYFVNGLSSVKVTSISCGLNHSLALTESGHVFSWGDNECGQLGRNPISIQNEFTPNKIELKSDIFIKKISCGHSHSLLLSREGEIYVFGSNNKGELGINTKSDRQVIPLILDNSKKFTDIASNFNHHFSCAVSQIGIYYIWGETVRLGCTAYDRGCVNDNIFGISEPRETQFKSFNEIFIHYFLMTYNTINILDDCDSKSSLKNKNLNKILNKNLMCFQCY